jgi:hypothetical protein
MPILIQELIASDSISQAVDKINFNFDQILLNGGGPVGPPGPLGPPGPIGGRGERGSLWYEDSTSSPGTDPNSLTFTGLVSGDNYLQANGDVWSWSGLTWSITSVNLLGPQGPAGSSGAWLKFGSDIGVSTINRNAIYPEPFGQAYGANNANEGISTVVIGAVVSSTPSPSSPITPTNALISNVLAAQIDSGIVASIIHQKTSGARAIMFHGGVDALDYYEQSIISNLANISLETDDTMSVNIPKRLIDPQSSLIGYSLNTTASGQLFRSGRDITFNTGLDTTLYNLTSVPDSSNFNVNAKQIPGLTYPEINFNQYDSSNINQARVQVGGDVGATEPVRSSVNGGKIVADSCFTYIFGRSLIRMRGNQIDLFADSAVSISAPTAITLTSPVINNIGNVNITGTIYVSGTGIINGNLQTNANLQVGLNSNLLGTLNVVGASTLGGEVTLSTVNPGSGDVLVRNTSTNKIEKLSGATPIPLGGIIMWSGITPPDGWAICDGDVVNGVQTPDLRGRFVVGSGDSDWTDIRLNKPDYSSFTLQAGFINSNITQNVTNIYPNPSGYPFIALGGTFPASTNRTFYRWDGITTSPSSSGAPIRYYWLETKIVGSAVQTILRSNVSSNYNDDFIGYAETDANSDPLNKNYKARYPVTTDKRVAPYLYITDDRRHFFAWHATSRSYRIGYSSTPIPANVDINIQISQQIVFLDRAVGINAVNFGGSQIFGIDTGAPKVNPGAAGDGKLGPGWGTWSYDGEYYVNGIRLDLPQSIGFFNTVKRKFNVGEYGGGRRYKISESQLPPHKHNGVGETFNEWRNSLLGSAGGADLGGIGDWNGDNGMYGTTYSGSNSYIDDSTPYFALAYIMYVGT